MCIDVRGKSFLVSGIWRNVVDISGCASVLSPPNWILSVIYASFVIDHRYESGCSSAVRCCVATLYGRKGRCDRIFFCSAVDGSAMVDGRCQAISDSGGSGLW